jgi:FkbM family methyltransferase
MANLRGLTIIAVGVTFIGGAVYLLPDLVSAGMTTKYLVTGKSPNCGIPLAFTAVPTSVLQKRLTAEQRKGMERLEVDSKTGLERWRTSLGEFWLPARDVDMLAYELAEQARGIYAYQGRGVRQGDIVLDTGANLGIYTRVALQAGASKVIAIEPVPENLECLRRNFPREIEAGTVVIYPKGVWDKDDVLPILVHATTGAADSFVMGRTGGEIKGLPLTTVDKMVAELGLPRVDYIKMDIEGAERKALAGARETLARWHPRMAICTYHLPDDPIAIPEVVTAAWQGYRHVCGSCYLEEGQIRPQVFFFE